MFATIKLLFVYPLGKGGENMQFPRKVMSLPEVHREMGISTYLLQCIAHTPGQKCAFRKSVTGKGKIWFDTDKLAKELDKRLVR